MAGGQETTTQEPDATACERQGEATIGDEPKSDEPKTEEPSAAETKSEEPQGEEQDEEPTGRLDPAP